MWPFDDAICGNCNRATVHSCSIYIVKWGALLLVVPDLGAAVAPLQQSGPQGNKGCMKGQAVGAWLRCSGNSDSASKGSDRLPTSLCTFMHTPDICIALLQQSNILFFFYNSIIQQKAIMAY